ncbi:hypothetical protein [Prevotella communis]|nr:hypothetical protein [Prevotella communis]
MNAVASNKTDETGGNGYRGCYATAMTMMGMPRFNAHTAVY